MGPSVQIMAVWIYRSLDEEEWLCRFIDKLVRVLDMTVIMPTVSVRLPISNYRDKNGATPDPNDEGISLVTMISESHIAMHTWPKHGKAFLEIASCKPYEASKVLNVIDEFFPDAKVEYNGMFM